MYSTGKIGVLLGDSAYALKRYLLTPFLEPSTPAEERYNKAVCKTRCGVECTIGILRNRFQCLMKPLRVVGPASSANVMLSCCVLHNIAIQNRDYYQPLPKGKSIQLEDQIVGDCSNAEGRRVRQWYVDNYFS